MVNPALVPSLTCTADRPCGVAGRSASGCLREVDRISSIICSSSFSGSSSSLTDCDDCGRAALRRDVSLSIIGDIYITRRPSLSGTGSSSSSKKGSRYSITERRVSELVRGVVTALKPVRVEQVRRPERKQNWTVPHCGSVFLTISLSLRPVGPIHFTIETVLIIIILTKPRPAIR